MRILHLILITFCLASCKEAYFSLPQPVDSANLTSFPINYQGKWNLQEQTLTISDNYFEIENIDVQTISRNLVTDSNLYKIKDELIYEWNADEKSLSTGHQFDLKTDSITIYKTSTKRAFLGNEIELKKITDGHILSYKSDFESKSHWYSLTLMYEKDNHLIVLSPRVSMLREILNEDVIHTETSKFHNSDETYDREGSSYFDSKLSTKEISTLIKKNCFQDTILYLNIKDQVKN